MLKASANITEERQDTQAYCETNSDCNKCLCQVGTEHKMDRKQIIERLKNGEVIHVNNEKEREAVLNALGIPSARQRKRMEAINLAIILLALVALVYICCILNIGTFFLEALQEIFGRVGEWLT